MAFAIRNLCVVGYTNGFTLWHYKAGKDTITDVVAENYFHNASDMFATGDVIIIHAHDGVTQRYVACTAIELVKIAPLL